jgi:hypothetical protein
MLRRDEEEEEDEDFEGREEERSRIVSRMKGEREIGVKSWNR